MLEQQMKTHWLRREQVQTPEVWWGFVDLEKLEFSSHFSPQALSENRGEVVFFCSKSKIIEDEFRWEVGDRGMARIRQIRIQNQRANTASETVKKWFSFDDLLNRILEGYIMREV